MWLCGRPMLMPTTSFAVASFTAQSATSFPTLPTWVLIQWSWTLSLFLYRRSCTLFTELCCDKSCKQHSRLLGCPRKYLPSHPSSICLPRPPLSLRLQLERPKSHLLIWSFLGIFLGYYEISQKLHQLFLLFLISQYNILNYTMVFLCPNLVGLFFLGRETILHPVPCR